MLEMMPTRHRPANALLSKAMRALHAKPATITAIEPVFARPPRG
jgi:hypothetical protein